MEYLPIGSIVLLKESTKRVMIYGRLQRELDGDRIWDYIACLYPEGNINADHCFLFDHEQIDKIIHEGYQDDEEQAFQEYMITASKNLNRGGNNV